VPGRGAPDGGPEQAPEGGQRGPPPLRPFGLVLHRDGSWTHEGHPLTHARLRAVFDRSVRFLPEEGKYAVQIGRFRGQIEVEEAGFFVREFDAATGRVRLSDGSWEPLEVDSLRTSSADGGLLCSVKRDLAPCGLPARFTHAAQAELMAAAEEGPEGPVLRLRGRHVSLPEL
jgi:hypothetical protein